MKTAISVPDDIFRAGERLARRLKVSRSELYSRALANYVAEHTEEDLIRQVNAVCESQDTSLDPAIRANLIRSLPREDW